MVKKAAVKKSSKKVDDDDDDLGLLIAAAKREDKRKLTQRKKAKAAPSKRVAAAIELFGADMMSDQPSVKRGVVGQPPAVAFTNDGIQLGTNLFAQEVTLNPKTVADRMRRAGVKPSSINNTGVPMYRLRDFIDKVVLADEAGKLDVDKLSPIHRKMHYQAETERNKLRRESGQLLEAGAVEKEMARQAKIIAQFFNTLPDILERDCELTPAQLVKVEQRLDMVRDDLYTAMVADGVAAHEHDKGKQRYEDIPPMESFTEPDEALHK